MSIEWINYKGRQILSCSYQEAKLDSEQLQLLQKQMKMIEQAPLPVLLLVNLQGAVMTQAGTQFTKDHLSESNTRIKKIAVVGASGLKNVIAQGIGRSVSESKQQMFDSLDAAKEWLVSS